MKTENAKAGQRVKFNVGRGEFVGTIRKVDADKLSIEREEDGKLVWRSAKVCTACR